jgi:murein DD-endopeptidase MepM/ murein hydrolase activator NlpD
MIYLSLKTKMKKLTARFLIALILSLRTCEPITFAQTTGTATNTEELPSQALTTALSGVKDLKMGIDEITKELFALDAIEREKNQNLNDKYRIARNEIVRVISSIDEATSNISTSIKKLATYQSQMKITMDQLAETRQSSSAAKDYLAEYLNLLYKMQLEIYDKGGNHINEFRLLLTSDNISKTLMGEEITEAMTLQLTHLIQQADQDEEKKITLLAKLGELKQLAQKTLASYYDEIERLQQKKQYLINFMQLYRDKQVADEARFDKVFASKQDVYNTIQTFLDEIVKKDYKSVDGISLSIAELANMPDASEKETSPIARPIYPIEKILRYFNDPAFEKEYGFKHQGIQIQAEQRTPVYAVRDGVIYHTFNNTDSISWIMIVHQKGYVSTYQYLNQILVKPGEIVKRGQIIGYSGGEP